MSNPKYRGENPFERDHQRRNLQKAKKAARRNRDTDKPRRSNWMDLVDEAPEVLETYTQVERIMPRDEDLRRQPVDVAPDENNATYDDLSAGSDEAVGHVVEVSTGLCRVWIDGRSLLCSLRGSLSVTESGYSNVIAVGDRVLVTQSDGESGVVEACLPRTSEIARPDPSNVHLRQVLAANVDQLWIIAAWRNPHVWPELIDRYLIAAQRTGVQPVLGLNKIDLAEDEEEVDQFAAVYRALGVDVILTSAVEGRGLDTLHTALDGKTSVLAGLSGVGKSSLLSAVEPGFALRTGHVN